MGIVKLSNNEYKITVELGYDILGKRKRKTKRFTGTLAEARYLNKEFIDELDSFEKISHLIIDKKFEEAYEETMKFIKQNEKWFVRAS